MSIIPTSAATGSQSLSSLVLQQLLGGSGSQATSGPPASVLQALMQQAGKSQTSAQTDTQTDAQAAGQAPAAVTQALGELLSGGSGAKAEANLATLQNYFKANPQHLASLLSDLQGAGTYTANGTVGSGGQNLLALLAGSGSGKASSAMLGALLGSQAQDPLLASLGGSSSSSETSFSLLG